MGDAIGQRMAAIEWQDDRNFTLDGVAFALKDLGDSNPRDDAFSVMKLRPVLEIYGAALAGLDVRNMVELGIRRGGSAVLFALLLQPERIISLDICERVKPLDRFRRKDPRGACITALYETSQDDEQALADALARETSGPLDLVIDDASHAYDLTRRSFEILFPRLRPGCCYVIEDWSWAHMRGFHLWRDQPALSNLLFQLMMVCGDHPELVTSIDIRPGLAFVWRGPAPPSDQRLDLDSLCFMQDRPFALL
jgi:predicted O-methyltransferase YrrM